MTKIALTWPDFVKLLNGTTKALQVQDTTDDATHYKLIAVDGPITYLCTLWKSGNEPPTLIDPDLADNTTWRTDYETNWAAQANSELKKELEMKQERKSNGHYWLKSLVIPNVPAGGTRYVDWIVPDFSKGVDWLNYHFDAADADSGDQIACGKLMVGQVGALAQDVAQGATRLTAAAPIGVLRPTMQGGALDEGFYISLGNDAVTDTEINAGTPPGTGSLANPQPELTEYMIQRISAPTTIGGGNEMVTLTLFTALATATTANTPLNLVIRGIPEPIQVTKGAVYDVGGRVFAAGNIPAGRRVRYGYQDSRAPGGSPKTIRATIDMMY